MTHPALTLPPQDCTRCGEPLQPGQTVERDGFGFPSIPPSMWRHSGGADGCIRAAVKQDQRTQRRVAISLAISALREVDDDDARRIGGFLDIALEGVFDREDEAIAAILDAPLPEAGPIHDVPTCGHPWSEHGVAGCLVKPNEVDYCACMWVSPDDPGIGASPSVATEAEDRAAFEAALNLPGEEPAGEEAR